MSLYARVVAWFAAQETPAYLVGGCVRDRLLSRPLYDLDLAVDGDGLALARRLANDFRGDYYPLDVERGTGRAILYDEEGRRLVVDTARLRAPTLDADLADRDFTINALAASVSAPEEVIDQHGGLADLAAGIVRPVSEASIRNDPLRALRAVRLAADLGFRLAAETEVLLRRDGPAVAHVSGERVRDEMVRLLARAPAAPWLRRLDELGLLTAVLPELEPLRGVTQPPPHHLDVLDHTLKAVAELEAVVDELRTGDKDSSPLGPYAGALLAHLAQTTGHGRMRQVLLKLAVLMHDTGKPATRSEEEGRIRFLEHERASVRLAGEALRRLRFNKPEVQLAQAIVRHHMRPLLLAAQDRVSARAIYRYWRDVGEAGPDVLLHALADQRATGSQDSAGLETLAGRMLRDHWRRQEGREEQAPLVDGHDLMRELGLASGPQIGALLAAIREAQVLGQVGSREEALALARRWLARRAGRSGVASE